MADERRSPSVSVVIPALDAAATIGETLRSILEQDYTGTIEVIVAHGPSRDDTGAHLARYSDDPRLVVIPNPTGSTPAGLNLALAQSSGEVIARCDAHAILPRGYLARAVAVLQQTGADNVGGVQAARGDTTLQRAIAMAQTTPLGVGDARYRTGGKAGPTDTVYLGVFRRSALDRVGGFDEAFARSQDSELNHRIRESGGVVYFDPSLRVGYLPRRTLAALWRQYFGYGRWKRAVVRRHPRALRWRQLVPPGFLAGLIASGILLATPWRWGAVIVPAAYVGAVVAAAITVWARRRSVAALLLPIVLPVMHVAWGLGFMVGPPRR